MPTSAQRLSTFSEMKYILLSIPTIVDANCEVHLGLKFNKIYKDNKLILQGDWNESSCMWTIDLVVPTITTITNLEELVASSVWRINALPIQNNENNGFLLNLPREITKTKNELAYIVGVLRKIRYEY